MSDRPGYAVRLAPAAGRQLRRLPPGVATRLRTAIVALGIDPRPYGVRKLRDSGFWSLRMGDVRVVYRILDDERIVVIERVARRSEATYRRIR